MSDINGRQFINASAYLPRGGAWSVQVDVSEDVSFAIGSAATVTIGDLVLVGTVVDGGPVNGLASYHVRAGRGAWDKILPPRQAFQSDPGVKYSTVFAWLQEQTGETIATDIPVDLRIPGLAWVPRGGPAWDTLRLLSVSWYVDPSGVTQVRERPSPVVSQTALSEAQLLEWRPEDGTRIYQTDTPSAFSPGATIENERIEQIWLDATENQIVLTLYSGAPSHGLATSLDRIVSARTPEAFYNGFYEYAVVSQDGPRLGVRPVSTGPKLGTIDRIFPWPGAPGISAQLVVGSSLVVAFLDGRPSKPIIMAYQPPSAPGGIPNALYVGAASGPMSGELIARETDPTQNGSLAIDNGIVPGPLSVTLKDPSGSVVKNWAITGAVVGVNVLFTVIPTPLVGGFEAPIDGVIDTPGQDKAFA